MWKTSIQTWPITTATRRSSSLLKPVKTLHMCCHRRSTTCGGLFIVTTRATMPLIDSDQLSWRRINQSLNFGYEISA